MPTDPDHPTTTARGDALEELRAAVEQEAAWLDGCGASKAERHAARRLRRALSAAPSQQAGEPTPAEAASILGRVLEGLGASSVMTVRRAWFDAWVESQPSSADPIAAVLSALAAEAGRDHPESNP